ncbi:Polyketide cyclase/dehydrase [Emticicia oligotrophica DSM 17448]|uniref:Polyketide cyclase/dehydrase n=1 Tax=Emticicia oligotrophica (strain DSM 17448 / CIP 109782 / MTCC 6937 / GPTSA100-15) TaxID=929562 RepID=A0ABN4AIU3_EMTOG|nr:SRPBCC domain-containing protein [Emticicia oligotrophica]AFK02024.1 Polyketide cyclase/dehydrase [Emticicia oligotrophica DSM 17448]
MKYAIKTEIVINASKERVYNALTDFKNYHTWNPFIIESKGDAIEGTTLVNKLKQGEQTFTFKPILTCVVPNEKFEWLGSLLFKGLFDGNHYFHIEELENGQVLLTHGENFSGILTSFLLKRIGDSTRNGFVEMNIALKSLLESR